MIGVRRTPIDLLYEAPQSSPDPSTKVKIPDGLRAESTRKHWICVTFQTGSDLHLSCQLQAQWKATAPTSFCRSSHTLRWGCGLSLHSFRRIMGIKWFDMSNVPCRMKS